MLSTISLPAIATRITNQLVRTSLGTQLSGELPVYLHFCQLWPTMESQPPSNLPREWKNVHLLWYNRTFCEEMQKTEKPQGQSSQRWSHNHRQICPANGKMCTNCGITGHFAKKCRKPKNHKDNHLNLRKRMLTKSTNLLKKSDDKESVNYIASYQQLYDQFYDSNCESDSSDFVAAISCDSANQLELLNAKIQFTVWKSTS